MMPPDDAIVLDTGRGRLWEPEDGILREVIDVTHLDEEHLPKAMTAYESLCKGRPRRQLVDVCAVRFASFAFLRGSMTPRAKAIIGPMGLLADNAVARMAIRLFNRLSTHPYPMRVFDSEAEAVEWLLQQPE